MDQFFVEVNTGEVYKKYAKYQDLEEYGEPIRMVNLHSKKVEYILPENLIRVTPTLKKLMIYQRMRPVEFNDVKWITTDRPVDKQRNIFLRDINPYLLLDQKKKRQREEALEKAERKDERFKEARVNPDIAYTDLRGQSYDIVNMWLRMLNYDITVMGRLPQVSKHFQNIMENDFIWLNALEHHYPYVSTHFMGPLSRSIHPWVRKMLDANTYDLTKFLQRYPKRLLELRTRMSSNKTAKVPIEFPAFKNEKYEKRLHDTMAVMTQTRWLSHIWQCGENIYALFATTKDKALLKIGKYMVHWNARTEQPFVLGKEGKKKNLIDFKTETVRILDHDQDGFVAMFEKRDKDDENDPPASIVYVRGLKPGLREPAKMFENSFDTITVRTIPAFDESKHLGSIGMITPLMIKIKNTIIPRLPDNNLDLEKTIQIGGDSNALFFLIGYNSAIMGTKNQAGKEEFFIAYDLLNTNGYKKGRTITYKEMKRYVGDALMLRPRLGMGMGGIMFHWHEELKKMLCFDYSELKIGNSQLVYYLPSLQLTSEPIQHECFTCSSVANFIENDESNRPFCSSACQELHYKK